MSGHSHWAGIKHKKEAEDKKRGKIFSKLSQVISVAAKDGSDPEMNPKLKQAIEEAKRFNMPKENIERAIKRGSGEGGGAALEEAIYEAVFPNSISLIIETITDNKNRTILEIRQIIQKYGGKIADSGSVKWLFERKGIIEIEKEENIKTDDIELKIIDSGADDYFIEEGIEVYANQEKIDEVKNNLLKNGLKISSVKIGWLPKNTIKVSEKDIEKYEKLLEALDENTSVQEIYSNIEF